MNLPEMFPLGEWNETKRFFNVKDGQYWCPVAEIVGEEIVLTPLGLAMSAPAGHMVADEPALSAVTAAPKPDMLTRKQSKGKAAASVIRNSIDDLEL